MNRVWWLILLLVIAFTSKSGETQSLTAFIDVNVIPMDKERILPHQTVLVSGATIVAIGNVNKIPIPEDAYKVEGYGTRYLLPGMADMHTHPSSDDATLYIANGVTMSFP